jgi:hypothetical protein
MRTHEILIAALLLGVAAAATGETRAASAYTSLTLSSPAACARACADDGICMAWSFRAENTCELSAVVATPPPGVIASGFAERAPTIALRQLTVAATPIATPIVDDSAATPTPELDGAPAPAEVADGSDLLLGGPDESDLRLGFGTRR